MCNVIIHDHEIVKAILSKRDAKIPGIEYCKGFNDFNNMGISVTGVFDYKAGRYKVFCEDNRDELQRLYDEADVIVDFNGRKFDRPLGQANGLDFPVEKQFDLLRAIWEAVGNDPDVFDFNTHVGYGLDACCAANFGSKKTGNGALAPILWQQGKIGQVIDYCLNDVALTRQLFERIVVMGSIISPRSLKPIKIALPDFVAEVMEDFN